MGLGALWASCGYSGLNHMDILIRRGNEFYRGKSNCFEGVERHIGNLAERFDRLDQWPSDLNQKKDSCVTYHNRCP
jgi:hypothetical protein